MPADSTRGPSARVRRARPFTWGPGAILTNRNGLSEGILHDVQEAAAGYGVAILRSDVEDLVLPGNLQDVVNRVLAAQRLSEAQLVEARTAAERRRIEADARAEAQGVAARAAREASRLAAEGRGRGRARDD